MNPLFDLPAPAALAAPRSPRIVAGPVTWAPYKSKEPRKCEDCMQVALEANREGTLAPLGRRARFALKQDGKVVVLLCAEHKNLRANPDA